MAEMLGDKKEVPQVDTREELIQLRSSWNTQFTVLSEYYFQKRPNFTKTFQEGQFLNDGLIFDATGIKAARACASAIQGSTWKGAARTFRLTMPIFISDTDEHRKYYAEITKRTAAAMDRSDAGFVEAYGQFLEEWTVFGTSAICRKVDKDDLRVPVRFYPLTIMTLHIAKGKYGKIDTFYYDKTYTVKEAVDTFGLENMSEDVKKKYVENKYGDEIVVCEAVEPRSDSERSGVDGGYLLGNMGTALKQVIFEVETKKLIREGGFATRPILLSRMYVLPFETYGRSCAMDALPTNMMLQAMAEFLIYGAEYKVKPATWTLSNSSVQGGLLDKTPGTNNSFDVMGNAGQPPVQPIYELGEMQSMQVMYEELKKTMLGHFYIDRLYDFNSTQRMTLGEAEMRSMIRGDALTPLYCRLHGDILTPAIEDQVEDMFKMQLLGVTAGDEVSANKMKDKGIPELYIPTEVQKAVDSGMDFYEIEYINPAERAMKAEEVRGTADGVNMFLSIGQAKPEILDRLDIDAVAENVPWITGLNHKFIRGMDLAKADREARMKTQAQMMDLQAQRLQSQSNQSNAQAQAAVQGQQANAAKIAMG